MSRVYGSFELQNEADPKSSDFSAVFPMGSNLANKPNSFLIKTILFTGLALIAFAANSVLCRLALGESAIDASTFTIVRLLSGSIASGIGYMIWYTALSGLSVTQAAVLQLLVPVIAAVGGVIFVSESISFRLTVSSAMILGGILMVVLGRYYYLQLKTVGKT